MTRSLVSIIIPCYNTGSFVHRLLDSLLEQDYPLIEVFAVNDGSTDNTEDVLKSYIPKFEAKGYQLNYIYQENSGQSAAVNNALKLVNGRYLMWPDSDDYYIDNTIISKLVAKMSSGNYAMGRCRVQFVTEDGSVRAKGVLTPLLQDENQFENYLTGRNGIAFPPIAYIADVQVIDAEIPERNIYTEKKAGQNWQLMIPLSYKHKCFYISDIGANVVERIESHSRGQFAGCDKTLEKMAVYERTILGTLDRMTNILSGDYLYYKENVINAFSHNRMVINILYFKTRDAFKEYKKLRTKRPLYFFACCFSLNKYTFLIMKAYLRFARTSL